MSRSVENCAAPDRPCSRSQRPRSWPQNGPFRAVHGSVPQAVQNQATDLSGVRVRARTTELFGTAEVATWLVDVFTAPDYRPPVLPKVATDLLALTRNPQVRLSEVKRLLERDPVITASMLRITNSAASRPGQEVSTIDEALVRLGLRRITEVLLEAALSLKIFCAAGYEPLMESLRVHSSATAKVAREIARYVGVDPSHAFLGGLLHDIGIAVAIIALSEHFDANCRPGLAEAWPAVLEQHEQAGCLVQQSWRLPAAYTPVFAHHHEPRLGRGSALTAVVSLADALASEFGLGVTDEHGADAIGAAQDALGLDDGLLARIRADSRNELIGA